MCTLDNNLKALILKSDKISGSHFLIKYNAKNNNNNDNDKYGKSGMVNGCIYLYLYINIIGI